MQPFRQLIKWKIQLKDKEKKMMKRFFILTAVLFAAINLPAQDEPVSQESDVQTEALPLAGVTQTDLLQRANEAYAANEFQTAAELYEELLKTSGESAIVYYNLSNSYYKLNRIAPSILNYERALLLEPGNKDIRFNLEIARLRAIDKIEPIGDFFLNEWFFAVQNLMSTDAWSKFGIICFVLLIACLFLFFFSRRIFVKKLGFYAGLGLLACVILGNCFAYNQKKRLTIRNEAIILTPTTTIKSSPDISGTDLFILHEGTKVTLKNRVGIWNEIETADGNVGWIRVSEIEVI
jgi:tetratricopeptide (TPR) repeat protein